MKIGQENTYISRKGVSLRKDKKERNKVGQGSLTTSVYDIKIVKQNQKNYVREQHGRFLQKF
jgi:hypothetical protein